MRESNVAGTADSSNGINAILCFRAFSFGSFKPSSSDYARWPINNAATTLDVLRRSKLSASVR